MRISAIDRVEVRWILDRAGRFVIYPNGKLRPAWTYREISRNLRRSRGLKLSRYALRRLVMREDFDLARRRGECFDIVRRLQH